MRFKLVAATVVGILLTFLSVTSADAATNTVTIGSVTLVNRVMVEVPVTVVCDPFQADYGDVSVFVTQANGRQVATGSSYLESFPPEPLLLTCDGVTQNHFVLDVFPDSGSPPFHGGPAIASAGFSVTSFSGGSESGSTGYTSVTIRG